MIGRVRSVVLTGMQGHVIDVEAHLAPALPSFTLVGLPDASLHESRERVRAAVTSSALEWPNRRITVNLSPASLPKSGAVTDLAIATAILAGAGLIDRAAAARAVHLGELGLDGAVRPVRGVLPSVVAAVEAGIDTVVVPEANRSEAELVPGVRVVAVASLAELAALYGNEEARPASRPQAHVAAVPPAAIPHLDLVEVRGQSHAKWALEVAAAGGHHLLMVGPPGAGKTMLASRLPGILPPLDAQDSLAVSCIHSIAGTLPAGAGLIHVAPFEAPHHSASAAAIVGGGARIAKPGAISRAHAGVLFLDEAPEFPSAVLQTLRQPLESGEVVLHRSDGAARYPARFQLVLAANPCPCGNFWGTGERCECSSLARRRYFARLGGPLLDRIDLQITVEPAKSTDTAATEGTADVARRVTLARGAAVERLQGTPWTSNSQLSGAWLRQHTPQPAAALVLKALDHGRITARGADRALRVAWTLSDLEGGSAPTADHVAQALTLRSRDAVA